MPAPTPAELKAEITNDPATVGYATPLGRTVSATFYKQNDELGIDELVTEDVGAPDDQAVADLLNAKTARGPVPIIDLSAYCTVNGITGPVEDATRNGRGSTDEEKAACRALCFSVMSILRNDLRLNNADMDDSAFGQMTGGLEAFGLLTPEQTAAIAALGENRRSRAEVLWGAGVSVSAQQIGTARNS